MRAPLSLVGSPVLSSFHVKFSGIEWHIVVRLSRSICFGRDVINGVRPSMGVCVCLYLLVCVRGVGGCMGCVCVGVLVCVGGIVCGGGPRIPEFCLYGCSRLVS